MPVSTSGHPENSKVPGGRGRGTQCGLSGPIPMARSHQVSAIDLAEGRRAGTTTGSWAADAKGQKIPPAKSQDFDHKIPAGAHKSQGAGDRHVGFACTPPFFPHHQTTPCNDAPKGGT